MNYIQSQKYSWAVILLGIEFRISYILKIILKIIDRTVSFFFILCDSKSSCFKKNLLEDFYPRRIIFVFF